MGFRRLPDTVMAECKCPKCGHQFKAEVSVDFEPPDDDLCS